MTRVGCLEGPNTKAKAGLSDRRASGKRSATRGPATPSSQGILPGTLAKKRVGMHGALAQDRTILGNGNRGLDLSGP